MIRKFLVLAAVAAGATAIAEPALAQNEQFFPLLVYRTGPYAPNGIPFADGVSDYLNLLNERDGGINGVKLTSEECETGYATDKGVECYERLKGKGPTGASYFSPLSTGITFALTEKAPGDKIPLLTLGYGRSESRDGSCVPVELHRRWQLLDRGRYRHPADRQGNGRLRQAEGQEDQPRLSRQPLRQGADPGARGARQEGRLRRSRPSPVTHPGVEQKSQWLAIRQDRPDYVLLWGWGVMNSTAIKEAAAVAYPRDKMIGVWWSGAEPDVTPAGDQSIGYKALMLQHPRRQVQGARGPGEVRRLQGQVDRQGRLRPGALQPRLDQLDARHRGDPHRAGQVRQEAVDRRADPLGLREPEPVRRSHQGARLRGHAEAVEVHLPGPPGRRPGPHPAMGRQGLEDHLRVLHGGSRRSWRRWSRSRPPSTRQRRRSRRATAPRRAEREPRSTREAAIAPPPAPPEPEPKPA